MKNFSFPVSDLSFEETLIRYAESWKRGEEPYMPMFALEVQGTGRRKNEIHALVPTFDSGGVLPDIGEHVECSALGVGSEWIITKACKLWGDRVQVGKILVPVAEYLKSIQVDEKGE